MHHLHAKKIKNLMGRGLPSPDPSSTGEGDTILFRLKILWEGFCLPPQKFFSNVGPFRSFAKS